jgi:hypothetical protein
MLRVFCSALSPLLGLLDLGVELLLEPPPLGLEEELWEEEEEEEDFFDDEEEPTPLPLEPALDSEPLP